LGKATKLDTDCIWTGEMLYFLEKTEAIILPQVGQDGFDSYHEMSDWGSDILKAGKGIGWFH
jgi:hypothetical protein